MRFRRQRKLWVIAGGLVAVLALVSTVALATRGDDRAGGEGPFVGVAAAEAPYDLRFIDEMTMHHRGAVMSARMMIADSARPELRDLARRITAEQTRQIEQMAAWRRQWYPDAGRPAMGMDGMGMMGAGMGSARMGKMGGGMMNGGQADRMFLRMMIPHHQLAVEMAEDALESAEHDELKRLAENIKEGQAAEIEEMEGYLEDWYGDASTRDAAEGMREMMGSMMGGMHGR